MLREAFSDEKDYSLALKGEQERMKESFASLAFALTLAILLVYMIMASEFESLWQPFLIMFTVPLSLVGVVIILFITQTPLSVVVYLGIIMLGGIVVNNGIVLIDLINNRTKQGMQAYEAVIKACQIRMRPILITSTTTVLGMFPLALGIGEGSELRAPLAIAVIGGLISGTFLTIVVLPCLYLEFTERLKRFAPKPMIETKVTPVEKIKEVPLPRPEFKQRLEEIGASQEVKPAPAEEKPPPV
jgi:HAE1 family hydrophobic/amphiphilic exporter-1